MSKVSDFVNSMPDKRNASALAQAFEKIAGRGIVAAAGSSQATATALAYAVNIVTGADATKAVRLPIPQPDDPAVWVINSGTAGLPVYPAVGGQINALGTDAAFTLGAGQAALFQPSTAILWYTASSGTGTFSGEVQLDGNVMATEAGAGITGGTGTVYKSSVLKAGGIITTRILLDLTGLGTSTTDLDVVGQGASAAHLGQITAARNGTILSGTMTCLETPATGADDLDLYSATVGTAVFDDGIAALTETALLTRGAAWAVGDIKALTGWPAANEYLYLTNGEAGTVGTFTAGKFLIELQGYDA